VRRVELWTSPFTFRTLSRPILIEGGGDIARMALESVALEALRAGRITEVQLRHMLGLARIELDGFLKARCIYQSTRSKILNTNGRPSKNSGSDLCGWSLPIPARQLSDPDR